MESVEVPYLSVDERSEICWYDSQRDVYDVLAVFPFIITQDTGAK